MVFSFRMTQKVRFRCFPRRVSWAIHEALVANPQGCRGAVTRVLWTIHDNLLNDGQLRMTGLLWCQLLYYCLFLRNLQKNRIFAALK